MAYEGAPGLRLVHESALFPPPLLFERPVLLVEPPLPVLVALGTAHLAFVSLAAAICIDPLPSLFAHGPFALELVA